MKIKVSDYIRRASDEDMARIIGGTVAIQTEGISAEEAMSISYPETLKVLKTEMECNLPQTNADRIRAMSYEELEEFLKRAISCGALIGREESSSACRGCKLPFCQNIGKWLQSEVEE